MGHTGAAQPHVYAPGTMELRAFSSAVSATKSAVAFLIFESHSCSSLTEQAASPFNSYSLTRQSPSATASARSAVAHIRLYCRGRGGRGAERRTRQPSRAVTVPHRGESSEGGLARERGR